jgi:uncharacterized alkaline shock family protein YloU
MESPLKNIDTKEVELPDTVFIRDIESRVFQSIAIQCLAKIEGVSLLEGTFIDSLLGRDSNDRIKGIYVDQDSKKHSIQVKVEINIAYGVSMPEKAEEVQQKISEEITQFTGLHVGSVHVVFKNLIPCKKALEETASKINEQEIEEECIEV